jgi:general secretion pathway protein N
MAALPVPTYLAAAPRHSAPWAWTVAGVLVGGLIAAALFAPARWLAWGLAEASQQRVQLLQPQGTVWQGSAQLVLGTDPGVATALPGRLEWHLRPQWLGAALRLHAPCCMTTPWNLTLEASTRAVQLHTSDLDASQALRLPSALLAGLGTPWNTIQLQGTLALQPQGFSLQWQQGALTLQGRLQVDALQMSTRLTPLQPVGSYRLELLGGDTPTLALHTLDGALQLQGHGQWQQGRLQFDGEARAAAGREDALANLLNIIGRRDGARSIIHVG